MLLLRLLVVPPLGIPPDDCGRICVVIGAEEFSIRRESLRAGEEAVFGRTPKKLLEEEEEVWHFMLEGIVSSRQ